MESQLIVCRTWSCVVFVLGSDRSLKFGLVSFGIFVTNEQLKSTFGGAEGTEKPCRMVESLFGDVCCKSKPKSPKQIVLLDS